MTNNREFLKTETNCNVNWLQTILCLHGLLTRNKFRSKENGRHTVIDTTANESMG